MTISDSKNKSREPKHTAVCEMLMDHQSACVCGAWEGKKPSNDALNAYLDEQIAKRRRR